MRSIIAILACLLAVTADAALLQLGTNALTNVQVGTNLCAYVNVGTNRVWSRASSDVTSGLVVWWKMESTNGNQVVDSIGTNNLTLYGSPPLVAGKSGNGLYFQEATQYARFTPPSVANNNIYSFCVWATVDDPNSNWHAVGGYWSGNKEYVEYYISEGKCRWNWNVLPNTQKYFWLPKLSATVWKLLCFVADGTNVVGYLDAVISETGPVASTNVNLAHFDLLARYYGGGGDNWFGKMDEFRIYNRALSSNEVLSIYNATK